MVNPILRRHARRGNKLIRISEAYIRDLNQSVSAGAISAEVDTGSAREKRPFNNS
jgi:hypothetical protein